jgi:hypothetical protein
MLLSVVIPAFDGERYLGRTLSNVQVGVNGPALTNADTEARLKDITSRAFCVRVG